MKNPFLTKQAKIVLELRKKRAREQLELLKNSKIKDIPLIKEMIKRLEKY